MVSFSPALKPSFGAASRSCSARVAAAHSAMAVFFRWICSATSEESSSGVWGRGLGEWGARRVSSWYPIFFAVYLSRGMLLIRKGERRAVLGDQDGSPLIAK